MSSTIGQGQIELPELLELRIAECEPGPILLALSTPVLQILTFHWDYWITFAPEQLSQYPYLRDLQWSDLGTDAVFELVFRRRPSLTRYANYVVGRGEQIDYSWLYEAPSIVEVLRAIDSTERPRLEEMLIDYPSCVDLLALVDLVPTIKRIRVFKDPWEPGEMETGQKLLTESRQK
ncbi:hypothetical protein FRC00_009233, partial [Tulasnella sp. 408]